MKNIKMRIIKRLRIENKILTKYVKYALYYGAFQGSKHKQFLKINKMIIKEIAAAKKSLDEIESKNEKKNKK